MVNTGGGTRTAADFTFTVNGVPQAFAASGTNTLTVAAGTYSVTETALADYTPSFANCAGLTVGNGETVTCTITNTYTPGTPGGDPTTQTLVVTKVVVNDNGGTAGRVRLLVHGERRRCTSSRLTARTRSR